MSHARRERQRPVAFILCERGEQRFPSGRLAATVSRSLPLVAHVSGTHPMPGATAPSAERIRRQRSGRGARTRRVKRGDAMGVDRRAPRRRPRRRSPIRPARPRRAARHRRWSVATRRRARAVVCAASGPTTSSFVVDGRLAASRCSRKCRRTTFLPAALLGLGHAGEDPRDRHRLGQPVAPRDVRRDGEHGGRVPPAGERHAARRAQQRLPDDSARAPVRGLAAGSVGVARFRT